jgi:hypothetical protein
MRGGEIVFISFFFYCRRYFSGKLKALLVFILSFVLLRFRPMTFKIASGLFRNMFKKNRLQKLVKVVHDCVGQRKFISNSSEIPALLYFKHLLFNIA